MFPMFISLGSLGISDSNLILFTFDNNIGILLLLTTVRNVLPVAYCCQFDKYLM